MAFINQAVTVLQTLVIALGAGLAVWGVVNLMEGYGNDNPGAKSQGIKQLMAGGGFGSCPIVEKTPFFISSARIRAFLASISALFFALILSSYRFCAPLAFRFK